MLSAAAFLYGKIVSLRNFLYDRGVFESFELGARTISIGNITTGGTGKTPLVTYVARVLADRGEKVCVLTRGYGRDDERRRVLVSDGEGILAGHREAGDEPVELADKLLGRAIVIADADRVAAAEWAKRKFGVTAFVLDDGFQHRRARRDVDIVCIDATDPFGGGKMLPAGRLREPVENLARADIVVITRADLVDNISNLRSEISRFVDDTRVFEAGNELHLSQEKQAGESAMAFCGVGNPNSFFDRLRREEWPLAATRAFPDHHIYTQNDIDEIEQHAKQSGAAVLVTTAKDAVKLSDLKFEIPYLVVEAEVILDDPAGFAGML